MSERECEIGDFKSKIYTWKQIYIFKPSVQLTFKSQTSDCVIEVYTISAREIYAHLHYIGWISQYQSLAELKVLFCQSSLKYALRTCMKKHDLQTWKNFNELPNTSTVCLHHILYIISGEHVRIR